jgi:hypothetical protein
MHLTPAMSPLQLVQPVPKKCVDQAAAGTRRARMNRGGKTHAATTTVTNAPRDLFLMQGVEIEPHCDYRVV